MFAGFAGKMTMKEELLEPLFVQEKCAWPYHACAIL
jgi:hypothetical protein